MEESTKPVEAVSFGETDVGISSFVSDGIPIRGITKYRVADFIVNEITPDRVTLFPLEKEERVVITQQKKPDATAEADQYVLPAETEATMKKLFGTEKAEKLIQFYADLEAGLKPLGNEFSIQVDCPEDKEERGKVHGFVRESLRHMDSETVGDNAQKSIRIFFTKNKAKRGKTETKTYHAVLFKTGTDNYSALSNVGKFLRLPPRNLGSAGIKDKRGVTTQAISITMNGASAELLTQRFQNAKWNGMKVQQIKEASAELRVGELYGNRFSIAIRLLDEPDEAGIQKNVDNLKANGFINYFGMQRFGNNPKCRTHQIGQLILKKEWEKVFDEIVGQETNDIKTNAAKAAFLKDKSQTKQALRDIHFKYKIERTLIQGYERAGMKNNFLTAICFLSRSMRNLYCHAYQSYIWNKLASERIARHGNKLIEGDLVARKRDDFLVDFENEDEDNDVDEIDADGEPAGKSKYKGINDKSIDIITSSNIDKYTINDVLIPMVGSQLDVPATFNLASLLDDLLSADGVTKQVFNEISQNFFVQGGYRLLICQPEEIEYSLSKFSGKTQDILTPYYNVQKDFNDPEGKLAAICLKFSLFKGAYATMLIRELTRLPSDFDTQLQLNKQYESVEQQPPV